MSEITAPYILQTALDALSQRAAIRDQPTGERSAGRAAAILEAWTGRQWVEEDVWRCLMAVKMAREQQGAFHVDDLLDLSAYCALLCETRARVECE
jgi:2-keto-3-deoxy-L-rhamnonate aldolase RhmA